MDLNLIHEESEMTLKTFEVSYRIYDTVDQSTYNCNAEITTLVQAQDSQQVQCMIEAQYQGRAHIWSIVEKY